MKLMKLAEGSFSKISYEMTTRVIYSIYPLEKNKTKLFNCKDRHKRRPDKERKSDDTLFRVASWLSGGKEFIF